MKRWIALFLVCFEMLSLSACGRVSEAEKKAYVEKEYADFLSNDFRQALPFENMIGMPLADVKEAVAASEYPWQEETSDRAAYPAVTGMEPPGEIACVFLNQRLHRRNESSHPESAIGLMMGLFSGILEIYSVRMGQEEYVYVVADDTPEQRVMEVLIVDVNSGITFEKMTEKLSSKYRYFEKYDGGTEYENCVTYVGLVSDADYGEIYDYDHGISSDFPRCLGMLVFCSYSNGCNVMWILPVSQGISRDYGY